MQDDLVEELAENAKHRANALAPVVEQLVELNAASQKIIELLYEIIKKFPAE